MKRLKNILLTVLLATAGALNAQNVRITGHVDGFAPGSIVRVLVYADQFSRLEKTLATTRTDSAGNFRMTFPVKETTYAMLAVNLKRTDFFLKPGAVYHFDLARTTAAREASPFEEIPLQVQMKADDDSLNAWISTYHMLYDRLIRIHFRDIYQFHNRQVLKDFETRVHQRLQRANLPYVQQYIRYSLASLAWGSRTKSLPEMVQTWFAGQPVLYQNIQYTDFFLDFFQSYFESTVKKPVTKDKLLQIISLRNLKKLDDLFATAPALGTDARVRQLAEMVQLAKCYYQPGFNKKDIEALYKQIAEGSPFPKNRVIAGNYLLKLNIMQPGTPAPDFLLPDLMGKEYALKNFRGKFVLLSFINAHCPVCNHQLNDLDAISQKLGYGFTNLTIVKGKVTPEFMRQANPAGHNWPFLLLGKSILLLEKYQIVTYPAYVLVDPQGRVSMAPAPMPDENLQQRIAAAINAYKKRVQN